MRKIIFCLAFLYAVSLFAATPSHFAKLLSFYDQGTLPNTTELRGIWSGRCYKEYDDNPIGAFLIAKQIVSTPPDNHDNGPLFPPQSPSPILNIDYVTEDSQDPAAFDTLSADESARISNALDGHDFNDMTATVVDGSLESVMLNVVKIQVRKFGNYFVLKTNFDASACYFYKKVQD